MCVCVCIDLLHIGVEDGDCEGDCDGDVVGDDDGVVDGDDIIVVDVEVIVGEGITRKYIN